MKVASPYISVWMVLTEFNIEEIELMIEKASSLGANELSLRMLNGRDFFPSESQLEKFKENFKKYEEIAQKNHIKLKCHFSFDNIFQTNKSGINSHNFICALPFYELVIFADGRVAPCCRFIKLKKESMGNVKEKSVPEIWFGERFEKFRRKILEYEVPEICKDCNPDFKFASSKYLESNI
jgi:radical SAM protein with 4Fe4S-binding SPASM domain